MMGGCGMQQGSSVICFWLLVLLQKGAGVASSSSDCASNRAAIAVAADRALLQTGAAATFIRLDSNTEEFQELPVPWDSTVGEPVYELEPSFEARLEANPFIAGWRRPNDLEVTKLHVTRYAESRTAEARTPVAPLEDFSGSDDHESVFAIKYNDFNNKLFWSMAALLFLYTFVIDMLKEKVIHATREDRCNRVFVDRLFAELMVFGVVAMSVFMMSQFLSMPMSTFHIFEFSDILISWGVFFLIFTGLAFRQLRDVEDKHLEKLYNQEQETVNTAIKEASDVKDLPPLVMDRAALEVTRSQFFINYRLDEDTFSWSIYLVESLNTDICKFIEINQFTWLFLMAIAVVIWGMHVAFGQGSILPMLFTPSANISSYMVKLVASTWFNAVGLAVIAWQAREMRYKMNHMLGFTDILDLQVQLGLAESSIHKVRSEPLSRREEDMLEWLKFRCQIIFQAAQVCAVFASILLGFYLMHVVYNLVTFGMPFWWHILFLIPPVAGFGLILPYTLVQYVHVQSFIDPDENVIDSVIETVGQAWNDLRFVQRQLENKAQAELTSGSATTNDEYYTWAAQEFEKVSRTASTSGTADAQFSKEDFASALSYVGVHVSKARTRRLFKVLAHDRKFIKLEEFLKQVFLPKSPHLHGVHHRRVAIEETDGETSTSAANKRSKSQRNAIRRDRSRKLGILRHGTRYVASDSEEDWPDEDSVAAASVLLSSESLGSAASSEPLAAR